MKVTHSPFVWGLILAVVVAAPFARADSTEPFDVVVVGAGPGGLSAALATHARLQEQGVAEPRILVVEKRGAMPAGAAFTDSSRLAGTAFARQQVIGVKPQVVDQLARSGFKLPERYRVRQLEAVGPKGPAAKGTTKPDLSSSAVVAAMAEANSTHVIRINELQSLLTDHARAKGIEVRFETPVSSVSKAKDGRVDIGLGSGSVAAKYVIGGDGAASPVREMVGLRWNRAPADGYMVGVWFKGIPGRNRILYPRQPQAGRSGVLLGDGKSLYGLFALPKPLATIVEESQTGKRKLSSMERAAIIAHCEAVAREMLPVKERRVVRGSALQAFPIVLNRVDHAVSASHRTLLIGDSVQTVNPYSGMGANIAIRVADLAARAIARAELATTPAARASALRRFDAEAVGAAKSMHAVSRGFRGTFGTKRDPSRTKKALIQARARSQSARKVHDEQVLSAPGPRAKPAAARGRLR